MVCSQEVTYLAEVFMAALIDCVRVLSVCGFVCLRVRGIACSVFGCLWVLRLCVCLCVYLCILVCVFVCIYMHLKVFDFICVHLYDKRKGL